MSECDGDGCDSDRERFDGDARSRRSIAPPRGDTRARARSTERVQRRERGEDEERELVAGPAARRARRRRGDAGERERIGDHVRRRVGDQDQFRDEQRVQRRRRARSRSKAEAVVPAGRSGSQPATQQSRSRPGPGDTRSSTGKRARTAPRESARGFPGSGQSRPDREVAVADRASERGVDVLVGEQARDRVPPGDDHADDG